MKMQKLTGLQYLQSEIVCKFDKAFEKCTWDQRIQAFADLDLLNQEEDSTYSKATTPIALRAALEAYKDTLAGIPTGYMISLDAHSSGLQFLSLLVSCPTSFSLCGGDSTQCVDSYTAVYEAMELKKKYKRDDLKSAMMKAMYGSKAVPLEVFGEDVDIFYQTLERMAPGAWDLNLGLQEIWDLIPGSSYDWILPDNFHCEITTTVKEELPFSFLGKDYSIIKEVEGRAKFHKGLCPNAVHSIDGLVVREMFRRCSFNKAKITRVINSLHSRGTTGKSTEMVKTLWTHYEKSGFLSTRILDYLYEDTMGWVDSSVIAGLIQSLPEKPFDLVTVHDNFRVHPNNGNDVREQYNEIMADINDSHMLSFIVDQLVGSSVSVSKAGFIHRDIIREANYTLG